jgi:hypothetical protein
MKKALWITISAIGTVVVLAIAIAASFPGTKTGTSPASQPTAYSSCYPHCNQPTAPAAPVAATPDPSGTYRGSCDYTLGASFGTYHLVGEVDLHNDGNIGTKDHVVITWPQEGAQPVKASRNVRSDPGGRSVVRFKVAANSSVIESLQSWQERHDFKDGCTYKVSITGTFGSAS